MCITNPIILITTKLLWNDINYLIIPYIAKQEGIVSRERAAQGKNSYAMKISGQPELVIWFELRFLDFMRARMNMHQGMMG